jgi:hypothetical protein
MLLSICWGGPRNGACRSGPERLPAPPAIRLSRYFPAWEAAEAATQALGQFSPARR